MEISRIEQSEKTDELFRAMLAVQVAVPAIAHDSYNSHLKNNFTSLDAILAALRPHLLENGLFVTQPYVGGDGEVGVCTSIVHIESGQFWRGYLMMPFPEPWKGVNPPQAMGASLSYARRFSLPVAFGILAADADAELLNDGGQSKSTPAKATVNRPYTKDALITAMKDLAAKPVSKPVKLETVIKNGGKSGTAILSALWGKTDNFTPGELYATNIWLEGVGSPEKKAWVVSEVKALLDG